jgi:hypothetical protein
MENMDFGMFLNWLVFGGGSVMAASFLLERIAWFQLQVAETKKYITYAASSLLGIGAYALITYAPAFVAAAQPYFMVLAGTFVMIFLNNLFHKFDKALPKG